MSRLFNLANKVGSVVAVIPLKYCDSSVLLETSRVKKSSAPLRVCSLYIRAFSSYPIQPSGSANLTALCLNLESKYSPVSWSISCTTTLPNKVGLVISTLLNGILIFSESMEIGFI